MELESGVCNLCNVNNMVFKASEGDQKLKILTTFLDEHFLSQAELQKIKKFVRLCVICSWKLCKLNEINDRIETESHNIHKCYFCKSEDNNIRIQSGWKYFENMTKPFVLLEDMPISVCTECIFFFDSLQVIKSNLLVKFPNLTFGNELTIIEVDNNTPKRKAEESFHASNSKQRKIFKNCLNYLEPLSKTTYNIKRTHKRDLKLYKRIPYICINRLGTNKKKTLDKSFMKIKLKDKSSAKRSTSLRRNSSFSGTKEDIEETPKAANSSELAPKRRVSVYAEPETNNDDEISDSSSMLNDDISEIVEKYINQTSLQENDNVSLLKDLENKVEKMADEENTIDKDKNEDKNDVEETTELSLNVDPMDSVLSKIGNILNVTADTVIDISEEVDDLPNDPVVEKSSDEQMELPSAVEKSSDEAIDISSDNSSNNEEQKSEETCVNEENVNPTNTDETQTEKEDIVENPIENDLDDVIEKQLNEESEQSEESEKSEKSSNNDCEKENDLVNDEISEVFDKKESDCLNSEEQNKIEDIGDSEEMNLSLSPDIEFVQDKEEEDLVEELLSDSNAVVDECNKKSNLSILNDSINEPERKKKRVTFSM